MFFVVWYRSHGFDGWKLAIMCLQTYNSTMYFIRFDYFKHSKLALLYLQTKVGKAGIIASLYGLFKGNQVSYVNNSGLMRALDIVRKPVRHMRLLVVMRVQLGITEYNLDRQNYFDWPCCPTEIWNGIEINTQCWSDIHLSINSISLT